MQKVFEVRKESDMTEGRGPKVTVAMFSDEDTAWEFANSKKGIMGRDNKGDWRTYSGGSDWDVKTHVVHDNLDNVDLEQQKQKALAKLTRHEKTLLGFA